ncbi:MAG: hypothetical protein Q7S81_00040 [bacterium]|nr:hypothetical protein [bacterium]
MKNKNVSLEQLRAMQDKIKKDNEIQERESRKAKFPGLLQLAIVAMRACRELTWNNKHGASDAAKKSELMGKVTETTEAFVKAYRQIVGNDLGLWWGAELQKEYVKGAPEALLVYYLSDNPNKTKPLAYKLKEAADEYVRGWGMLGKKEKDRKELSGPIEIVGNGELAVQSLIEQLSAGDEIQKIQVTMLEELFKDPITHLGKPAEDPEKKNFTLGATLSVKGKGDKVTVAEIVKDVIIKTKRRQ